MPHCQASPSRLSPHHNICIASTPLSNLIATVFFLPRLTWLPRLRPCLLTMFTSSSSCLLTNDPSSCPRPGLLFATVTMVATIASLPTHQGLILASLPPHHGHFLVSSPGSPHCLISTVSSLCPCVLVSSSPCLLVSLSPGILVSSSPCLLISLSSHHLVSSSPFFLICSSPHMIGCLFARLPVSLSPRLLICSSSRLLVSSSALLLNSSSPSLFISSSPHILV